jgi:hypothetical protein
MFEFGGFDFEITSFQPSTVDRASDDSRRADAPIASSLCLFRLLGCGFFGFGSWGSRIQGLDAGVGIWASGVLREGSHTFVVVIGLFAIRLVLRPIFRQRRSHSFHLWFQT